MTEPIINIGIVSAKNIAFELKGDFLFRGNKVSGDKKLCFEAGKITFDELSFDEIIFEPKDDNSSFVLKSVMIGKEFHWQQTENQEFRGALKFIVEDNQITAINLIPTEEYLTSVISSEMSANASLELLKAHAVISRSWLLANLKTNFKKKITNNSQPLHSDSRIIKWYERDAHTTYDVCADDHCQRYQGITRSTNPVVFQAIKETYGETLMFNNEICDLNILAIKFKLIDKFFNNIVKGNNKDKIKFYIINRLSRERKGDKYLLNSPLWGGVPKRNDKF